MPRRGAKAPSSDGGLSGSAVTVVSGSIRTPDDPDALNVKLSIWATEITMRVDGAELGNWESSEVSIRALDSTSYEFVAEGDHLIFSPDDPDAFTASSLVKGRVSGGGRKKSRKDKKKTDEPPVAAAFQDSLPAEESRRGKRRSAETPRPAKVSRRERKAAERENAEREAAEVQPTAVVAPPPQRESTVRQAAVPTPIGKARARPSGMSDDGGTPTEAPGSINIPAFREPLPEPITSAVETPQPVESRSTDILEPELVPTTLRVEPQPAELLAPEPEAVPEKAPRQKRSLRKRPARGELPDEVAPAGTISEESMPDEPEEEGADEPNRMWIKALDVARRYDFLGLDRVPVNESLRGQEHQHTWDHRVAPTSGLGKYVCTLCGEIRR